MHLPTGAGHSSDDFFSGSKAALAGGTTTLIDFVTPKRGQSLTDALTMRRKEAALCLTDYSFHVSPVEWRDTTAEEMKAVINEGMTSFKVYMAYKDAIGIDVPVMERVMQTAAERNALVTVHAETGEEVDRLRRQLAENGEKSPAAIPGVDHPTPRAMRSKQPLRQPKKPDADYMSCMCLLPGQSNISARRNKKVMRFLVKSARIISCWMSAFMKGPLKRRRHMCLVRPCAGQQTARH